MNPEDEDEDEVSRFFLDRNQVTRPPASIQFSMISLRPPWPIVTDDLSP